MSEAVIARCPGCRTAFRVTPEQLALREGQVRCGQCRAVFDANDHLVAGDGRKPGVSPHPAVVPAEPPGQPTAVEAAAAERPVVEAAPTEPAVVEAAPTEAAVVDPAPTTPAEAGPTESAFVEAAATEPAVLEAAASAAPEFAGAIEALTSPEPTPAEPETPPASEEEPAAIAGLDRVRPYEWRPRKPLHEQPRALYTLAIVALVALLGAQALFEYRDALAAHAPFTRPLLEAGCRVAGCSIAPLRDASALFIEASDLEADPAHKGLLKLSATVRNRASYPIAYPYLELTLTDAADHVVARRAFPPATYAAPAATGIAPNGEVLVRLFLDASATSQAGYRVYLFYP